MICRFCLQEKGKLCKAHILAEVFYRYMYPSGKVERDALVMMSGNKDYVSRKRVGVYDTNILCAECDHFIGWAFDQYGSEVILNRKPQLMLTDTSAVLYSLSDVDAGRMKLFFLSVLWRAAISQLEEFRGIILPDKFQNDILTMLKSNDPGILDDFSVLVSKFSYKYPEKGYNKLLQLPQKFKIESLNYVSMYFPNGYKILIKVDSRPQPERIRPLTIEANKPLVILGYELFEQSNEYKTLRNQAKKFIK